MSFWVYIVASGRNGTLYVGHTDDLPKRIWEHRTGAKSGFASRHGCTQLVWMEPFPAREEAKSRERAIKHWYRAWKLRLIEADNPDWRDLYDDLNSWWSRVAS
jgi:putative endonuclease